MTNPTRAPVNAHTLANAVFVRGAVYYQNPEGGSPELLVSAEELDERKMTQDRWIREQRKALTEDSARKAVDG